MKNNSPLLVLASLMMESKQ